MNVKVIENEIVRVWDYIQCPYDDNPEEVKLRLRTLSSYFSWVNANIPKAKKRYTDSLKSGLLELAASAADLNLSKTLQNALIDSVKGEERQLWDELLNLDRAISKDMAACTSILSYAKEEMNISKYQAT